MTNFEKYSKDMDTTIFAVVKGKPVDCDATVPCNECDLFCKDGILACVIRRMEWLKSEYEEPKINIPEDTPIDTRVLKDITQDSRTGSTMCGQVVKHHGHVIRMKLSNGST